MTVLRRRPAPGSVPRRRGGPVAAEARWAWLFLAQTLIGLAILSAGPILATFGISLTKWDLLTSPDWVGLQNYAALAGDKRFLLALRNTGFYTVVSVPLGMALALGLAVALNQAIRGIAVDPDGPTSCPSSPRPPPSAWCGPGSTPRRAGS